MDKINIFYVGFGIIGALFFFYIGYVVRKYTAKMKVKYAEARSKAIVEEAKKEAEARKRESQLEAKDLLLKMRSDFEKESKDRKRELVTMEKRLMQREENGIIAAVIVAILAMVFSFANALIWQVFRDQWIPMIFYCLISAVNVPNAGVLNKQR